MFTDLEETVLEFVRQKLIKEKFVREILKFCLKENNLYVPREIWRLVKWNSDRESMKYEKPVSVIIG
jgi:hypothetical protein